MNAINQSGWRPEMGGGSGEGDRRQPGEKGGSHATSPFSFRTWTTCIMPACMW